MSDQTGLYQDGNSVFENVFIQGTLNVATKNEKLVVHSDGITIDTITTNSDGKTTFTGDVQINGDEFFISDSIKHVGDTDTLISFPSNDTINFRTNGTERFRIADNGRVGINSASPAATLDVRDVGSTGPGILISGVIAQKVIWQYRMAKFFTLDILIVILIHIQIDFALKALVLKK